MDFSQSKNEYVGIEERDREQSRGAIIPCMEPMEEIQSIMWKYISDATVTNYTNESIKLMFYLFDIGPETHFYDCKQQAMKADEEDKAEKGNTTRRKLRMVFKDSLKNVRNNHCPIILETVDFTTFSHYVTTRKAKNGNLLSKSAYGGIHSYIMYLHKITGHDIPHDFTRFINQFNRGMKRKVTEEKMSLGRSLEEGKKGMSFEVYKLMCSKFIEMDTEDAVFAHLFLILQWNLMARSSNMTKLQIGHIEWRNDCLVFFFGKTKNDQIGGKSDSPWHVYSNPFEPCICPVLALAKYIFSNLNVLTSNVALFPGNEQYSR